MSATQSNARAESPSRRDFLKVLTSYLIGASSVLAGVGLLRFLDYETDPPRKTTYDLGLASDYPMDSRTTLPDAPALLIHTPGGFRAISLTCTHLGCTVETNPDGFLCPCHGSRYDVDGKLLRGPAVRPLRPLRIEIAENEHVILHTD